ncbi:hypothetical protein [Nocardioides sp. Soil796]|uniref:hypothetical protein n=1 Tax=Nocardioides sp. Soil796 TaxID=1736412 RepID=UPI0012E351FA|nr:hypothetical protein [Nocardioides sp. Soil796]
MDAPPTKLGDPVVRKLGIVAAVLSLTLIAACGDDEKDRDLNLDKSASSSPSETSSESSDVPANLPAGMTQPSAPENQTKTLASAKEFTGFALQLVQYGFAARDVSVAREIVADWSKCKSCKSDAEVTRQQIEEGIAYIPNRLPTAEQVYVMDQSPDRYSLVTTFKMPAGKKINDAGRKLGPKTPTPGSFEADLRWSQGDKSWLLEDYRLTYGG